MRGSFDRLLERTDRFLFVDRSGATVVGIVFFVLTTSLGVRYLHDEGLLPFELFRLAIHDFPAGLFFHKIKPISFLLYSVPSVFGFQAYRIAHCAVGAASVILASEAARRAGIARPNVAGWALATSSLFTVLVSNGAPNPDFIAFFALFLVLYWSDNRRWAGLVLGMFPLVRYEAGLVTAVFILWDLVRRRNLGLLRTSLVIPVVYVAFGAVYHHNILWVADYFVPTNGMPEEWKTWGRFDIFLFANWIWQTLGNNSPLIIIFALPGIFIGIYKKKSEDLLMTLLLLIFYTAIAAMIAIRITDYTLRSSMLMTLPIALLAASGLSHIWRHGRSLRSGPPEQQPRIVIASWALLRLMLLIAAVSLQARQLAATGSDFVDQHVRHHELMSELVARGLYRGQPLLSSVPIGRYDFCAGITLDNAYLLANSAMVWEIEHGFSAYDGDLNQAYQVFESGRCLFQPETHAVRHDGLYVLERRPRADAWRRRIEAEHPRHEIVGQYDVFFWPGPP